MTSHQPLQQLPPDALERSSFPQCMNEAARHSQLEDHQLAQRVGISAGYMSKFMRHVGAQWAARLVAYMRETNSVAPLQWLANQMGCDLVVRSVMSAELAAARAVIAAHGRLQA